MELKLFGKAFTEACILIIIYVIGKIILTELRQFFVGVISKDTFGLIAIAFIFVSTIAVLYKRHKETKWSILYGIIASSIILYFAETRILGLFLLGMAILIILSFLFNGLLNNENVE